MKAIYPWRLKIGVLIVICVSYVTTNAQTVIKTSDNFGAGYTEYIWNAYTGSGEVTNSYEFVPFGYNANDLTVKYPIIFFFPAFGIFPFLFPLDSLSFSCVSHVSFCSCDFLTVFISLPLSLSVFLFQV